MKFRPGGTRAGFTLIEMVLVIGAISIALGLCAGTIHALLKVHRSSREHLTDVTTVGRLALQFRRDARAATGAKTIGDAGGAATGLELTIPDDGTITYRADRDGLIRTERRSDEDGRRDRIFLPRRGTPGFEVADDRGATLAVLVLTRPSGGTRIGEHIRELRIEGDVGRDDRLRKGGRRRP
jgi:prepilin-type N-terminal cleavage/methylation domain-containing protein